MAYNLDDILNSRNGYILLYRAVRGSHAFGLATENSDIDEVVVFAEPVRNTFDLTHTEKNFKFSVENESHDLVAYEINRFIQLVTDSNPNSLENIFIPDEWVLYVHPQFKKILELREIFLSKSAFKKYQSYAVSQIKKARGLHKQVMMPYDMKRQTPLDFVAIHRSPSGSTNVLNWLEYRGLRMRYCAPVNVPNIVCGIAIYYDFGQHFTNENISADDLVELYHWKPEQTTIDVIREMKELETEDNVNQDKIAELQKQLERLQMKNMVDFIMRHNYLFGETELRDWYDKNKEPIGYRGIINEEMTSNELRFQSIAPNVDPIAVGGYNKDGYSQHCKDYREHQEWLNCHNPNRYKDNRKVKDELYDTKNVSTCARCLFTALTLAETGEFVIRRDKERDLLLSIKNGEWVYDDVIKLIDNLKLEMDAAIEKSTMKEEVDKDIANQYLVDFRKWQIENYGI